MPKFLVTVVLICVLSIAGLFYVIRYTSPSEPTNLAIFFFLFFSALTLVLSIPIYLLKFKRAPLFTDLRQIYRSSLKTSAFVSTFFTGLGVLKVLHILNLITALLFVTFFLIVGKLLTKS